MANAFFIKNPGNIILICYSVPNEYFIHFTSEMSPGLFWNQENDSIFMLLLYFLVGVGLHLLHELNNVLDKSFGKKFVVFYIIPFHKREMQLLTL